MIKNTNNCIFSVNHSPFFLKKKLPIITNQRHNSWGSSVVINKTSLLFYIFLTILNSYAFSPSQFTYKLKFFPFKFSLSSSLPFSLPLSILKIPKPQSMGTLSLLQWQKVPASHHRHISPKPLLVQVFLNKKISVVYDLIFVILDLGIWIWFDFL